MAASRSLTSSARSLDPLDAMTWIARITCEVLALIARENAKGIAGQNQHH
ncbi:hypothetical protein [Bradyrhizobium septentrionale]|uniref:Uncharacterized protein n=1 Tax=Bradyrhizobium septentrionale TaxID=1404411 RepID=A0A973ZZ68_9BRAD|nr:hypothetical protein [Bradyrhizobium septentrionale]UGY19975.1 hypothetical protein HAP48_0022375 [Bradyrhizobium septentrionale]UGY28761.1 hypothetical protein HU675_0019385 [Bradyrhizobium septentrionale]